MRVNKPATTVAFAVAFSLTGCSFISDEHWDVNHGGQADVVEASTNTNLQKNETDVNNNTNVSVADDDNSVDKQYQTAKNNQAMADNPTVSLEKHAVYFLHDSDEIDPDFMPLIEKQSQELLEHSGYTLILEGHADERGSREYTIGLGEERAKAVAKIMQARGVRSNQLEIVSYGEEKPASREHTETAWHLSCRVNLIHQRTQK